MTERPIIFNSEMIKAILDGRKTETRRVIKSNNKTEPLMCLALGFESNRAKKELLKFCPYGKIGDHLWMRENWKIGAWSPDMGDIAIDYLSDGYCRKEWLRVPNYEDFERYWLQCTDDCIKAGAKTDGRGNYKFAVGDAPTRKRPSIFMPRWASRIQLEIIEIKVERVQDITEEGAIAEGIQWGNGAGSNPRVIFSNLWDSINEKRGYSWSQNPQVWMVKFRVLKGDQE